MLVVLVKLNNSTNGFLFLVMTDKKKKVSPCAGEISNKSVKLGIVEGENQNQLLLYKKTRYVLLKKETWHLWVGLNVY